MLRILLILTLVIRISLFFLQSFQVDMNGWKAWSFRLVQVGPANFYSPDYFSDYFPGYLYILWISGVLFNLLGLAINSLTFEVFLKSVTTLFDFGSAFFIYKIVSNYRKNFASLASIFYLINPAVAFNTSVWGQIDGIFTFFLLMSAQFLFEKKKIFKSAAALSLGILIKPQSLAFVPILAIHLWKNFPKEIFKSSLFGLLLLPILSFPFFPKNPIFGLADLGSKSQDVYQYTSLFAFNFWGIFGAWKPDNLEFILSLKTWGIVLYLCSIVLISLPLLEKKIKAGELYFAVSLSLFSFFLFLTRMHERYLFPFLAFILIAAITKKSKLLFAIYVLSSLVHFINLWFVYYYYNFVYNDSKFADNFLYVLVNNNFKIFSTLMLLLFAILLIYFYRSIYVKK